MYAGHPAAAFDSLLEVVQVYHTNPQLWLRLAEACIAAQAKGVSLNSSHTLLSPSSNSFLSSLSPSLFPLSSSAGCLSVTVCLSVLLCTKVEEERLHKRSFKNVLVSEVFGKNLHRKLVVAPRTNTVHGSNQE